MRRALGRIARLSATDHDRDHGAFLRRRASGGARGPSGPSPRLEQHVTGARALLGGETHAADRATAGLFRLHLVLERIAKWGGSSAFHQWTVPPA
jgi:hypothetical protein